MNIIDKEQITNIIKDYWDSLEKIKTLEETAYYVGKDVADIRGSGYPAKRKVVNSDDDERIIIAPEVITIQWQEYHCGDTDYYSLEFPTSYLWDENYPEIEKQIRIKKEKELIEKKEREDAKRKEERRRQDIEIERRERQLFENLKKKYEPPHNNS